MLCRHAGAIVPMHEIVHVFFGAGDKKKGHRKVPFRQSREAPGG
jgi:hypothetical protein